MITFDVCVVYNGILNKYIDYSEENGDVSYKDYKYKGFWLGSNVSGMQSVPFQNTM